MKKKDTTLRKLDNNYIEIYMKKNMISAIIWFVVSIAVCVIGIYFREYIEIFTGFFGIIASIVNFKQKNESISIRSIKNKQSSKFFILTILIVFFSIVNPIGIIAVIYDLNLREWSLKIGEENEKNI